MTADELTARLATLVERPTQITETLWGPRLDVDAGVAPSDKHLEQILARVNLDG